MQKTQKMETIKQWTAGHRERLLWLAYVLLTLPHFNPMDAYSLRVELIADVLRVISTLVIVVWAVLIRRRLSPIVLLIGLWQGYSMVITILCGGSIWDAFLDATTIGSVVLLYDLMQEERKIFLSSQMFCFELMIYINLATVLLFPGGMYHPFRNPGVNSKNIYFLGFDNAFAFYCTPAFLILSLYPADTRFKKLRKVLLAAAIYFTALKTWTAAVLVTLVGMGIAWLFIKKLPPLFNFYSVWSVHIIFFVGIICLRLQNLFRWLIDGVLHKWNSLVTRMDVWDKTMKLISQAWLFGHGHVDHHIRAAELGYDWATQAHNLPLELLYRGGIINLALFVLIIYVAGRRVYKYRGTRESKLITIAVLGWCLGNLVEGLVRPFLMAMLVIAWYSNRDVLQPGEKDPLDVPKWDEWLRAHLARR